MTLNEMLRLLGITEKDASALRLVDGVIPSVDFVDLGANGEGEGGFLVKKGRQPMTTPFGTLTVDKNGNYKLQAPVAKGADSTAKMSATNKAALAELVTAQETHLAALKKELEEVEEDDTVEGMPEGIKTLLAGLAKGITVDEPAVEADPDAGSVAAAPATKAADTPVGPDPVPADPKATFEIGEMILTGNLATIAKGMADAAGDSMDAAEFTAAFGPMAELQAKFSPSAATSQAMASVSKRMDSQVAELKADNQRLQATVEAIMAGGVMGSTVIPDGAPQAAPTQKSKPGAPVIPCGQDISQFSGEDYNFIPKA